jgi:hypothetical protein
MHAERTQREDIAHFLNACFACTGQREFYEESRSQRVSIEFLHEYVLVNYRSIYARSLAAGINHFNQGRIIVNLLATGKDALPGEGALIGAALRALPPQRAWKTLQEVRRRGINNRRSRAIAREFLQSRDAIFDSVKYRSKVKAVTAHCHLKLPGELGEFLFEPLEKKRFATPLLEKVRAAWYSADALYELPYTVAEGLAVRHKIPRARFLEKIAPRLTDAERLRLQGAEKGRPTVDLTRAPLTKLALYVLSLESPDEEVLAALDSSARRTLSRTPLALGRVALVLDNSYSSSGTREKRRRPLGIALGVERLLRAASRELQVFWTHPFTSALPHARGATDLATPILDALETRPELLIIVSDGAENDPPGGAATVLRLWRKHLDPDENVGVVHLNPVFAADEYAPRALSPVVPTVGLRDAEDLPTALAFARFAGGTATRADLETYLDTRVTETLRSAGREGSYYAE